MIKALLRKLIYRGQLPSIADDQQWLQQALDQLPLPLFLLNVDKKKIAYLNDSARKMLGIEIDNFSPIKSHGVHYQVFDPNTRRRFLANEIPSARVFNGEVLNDFEIILKSAVGEFQLKVFSSRLPDINGDPRWALVFFQDISALKKIETELRETQTTLNTAVEAAQIGFWQYDVRTGKVILSPILIKQFGIDIKNFNNTLEEVFKNIHPEDADQVAKAINESIETKKPYRMNYRVKHNTGEIYWIEANVAAIFGADGVAVGLAGTTLDITAEVKAKDLIQASKYAI